MSENFLTGSLVVVPGFIVSPEDNDSLRLAWYALLYEVDRRNLKPILIYNIIIKIIGKMKKVTVEPTKSAMFTLSDPCTIQNAESSSWMSFTVTAISQKNRIYYFKLFKC